MSRKVTGTMHMNDVGTVRMYPSGADSVRMVFHAYDENGKDIELTVYVSRWELPEILKEIQKVVREWFEGFTKLAKTFGVV